MKSHAAYILMFFFLLSYALPSSADESLRRSGLMNGNQITTSFWNYGSFSAPGNSTTDFLWHGLGYAYEINFFIGAEVEVPQGSHPDVIHLTENGQDRWVAHVISDGLVSNGGEFSPDLQTRWSWQPVSAADYWFNDFLNPLSGAIAHTPSPDLNDDGLPDSWPDSWWRADQNAFSWPGLWAWNDNRGDLEALYAMDDRDNAEFAYYPFNADSGRRGLGVQAVVRVFQLSGAYEDVLFITFDLKNVSDKDLNKTLFGVWGDPHIGGSLDFRDDWQAFDAQRQMIYAYDGDGTSLNNPSITPGYFGLAFAQTPGEAADGIDNDGDGLTDESQFDGLDNDHDWDPASDDVGADGLPDTGDDGEGDGLPTPGEPNFEFKDMDEADMVGLKSMGIKLFSKLHISDDEQVWQALRPNQFDSILTAGDYALLGGSGYFSLKKGESKRVGVIFAMGDNKTDLDNNMDYATIYYHDNLGGQSGRLPLSISSPQERQIYSDAVTIRWDPSVLPAEASLALSYSTDNGASWHPVALDIDNNGSYLWDVSALPNSAFYRIRLRSVAPVANALAYSEGLFTVDHSGLQNVPPEVFLKINENQIISGERQIHWLSGDADGDSLNLQLSINSAIIHDTISVAGHSWTINSADYPNGSYLISLNAFDGQVNVQTSVSVIFSNDFSALSEELVSHRSGHASGRLEAHIFAANQLKARRYFVFINDSIMDSTRYSVIDSASGRHLVDNDLMPLSPAEGRVFDGLCLSFVDDALAFDAENSGWNISSQTDLQFDIQRNNYPPDPFDYDIIFYNHIVDTSVNNGYLPFRVWDVINNAYMEVATITSGEWTSGHTFYILRGGKTPDDIVWEVHSIPANIPPSEGDVFHLRTRKPFASGDTLVINTIPLAIGQHSNPLPLTLKLFQNYPNPFNNATKIVFYLPQKAHVSLELFNILGQKVVSIAKGDFSAGQHQLIWNGLNKNGQELASGVYLYRLVTSRQIASKKLILIR